MTGAADGTGAGARFYGPSVLPPTMPVTSMSPDEISNAIRKINPKAVVTTLAAGPR